MNTRRSAGAALGAPFATSRQSSQENTYRAAFPLAVTLYRDVGRVRESLIQLGLPTLLPNAHKAVAAVESAEDAVLNRLPMAEVQHRLQLFDETWQPFAAQASRAFAGSAAALGGIDRVNADTSSLRRVLAGKEPLEYDQVRAMTLARQLHAAISRLDGNLDAVRPTAGNLSEMQNWARWVQQHAEKLASTIDCGADRSVVAGELQQFDGAWNSFLRLARSSPRLNDQMRGTMTEIAETDQRLKNELGMPEASATGAAVLESEIANLAAAANDLRSSLESEAPHAPPGVLDAAKDFSLQAENCSLWLLSHSAV